MTIADRDPAGPDEKTGAAIVGKTLRRAVGDIEKDDVSQLFQRGEMRERTADLTCADSAILGLAIFGLQLGCAIFPMRA